MLRSSITIRALIAGLLMLLLVPAVVAQPAEKGTATVWLSPYELGAAMDTVLKADSELQSGGARCAPSPSTTAYTRTMRAPIGRLPYTATLWVNFWDSRVACVGLQWPVSAFSSVNEWRDASATMYKQLATSYDQFVTSYDLTGLRAKGNIPPFTNGAGLHLIESNGNELLFATGNSTITLVYTWGPFQAEIGRIGPAPTPRYKGADYTAGHGLSESTNVWHKPSP